jgi:hypothetical protein
MQTVRFFTRQNPNINWEYYQGSWGGQKLASGYFEGGEKSPYPRKAVHKTLAFGPGQQPLPVLMSFEITNGSGRGGRSHSDSVMSNIEMRSPGSFGMAMAELLNSLTPVLALEPDVQLEREGGQESRVAIISREFDGPNRLADAKSWAEHFVSKYAR